MPAAGGDLVPVNQNQPRLVHDVTLRFDPPGYIRVCPLVDRRTAEPLDDGPERSRDRRVPMAATDLIGNGDWAGHAQVVRIERTWHKHGHRKRALHDGITSLPPTDGPLRRSCWRASAGVGRSRTGCTGVVNPAEDANLIVRAGFARSPLASAGTTRILI